MKIKIKIDGCRLSPFKSTPFIRLPMCLTSLIPKSWRAKSVGRDFQLGGLHNQSIKLYMVVDRCQGWGIGGKTIT